MNEFVRESLSMAEVRRRTGVSDHTLRYYERIGLLKNVGRRSNGHRLYSPHDLEWITMLQLLRSTGMPIRKMLHFAALKEAGVLSLEQRIAYLRDYQHELGQQISMREAALRTLDDKIARHQAALAARPIPKKKERTRT